MNDNRYFPDMNWKQKIFSICYWISMLPYLLYSLIVQLIICNFATLLFKLDIKTQELLTKPYDYILNKLDAKNNAK